MEFNGMIPDYRSVFLQTKNPVVFSKGSQSLYLLQQLRDEAHRFAGRYLFIRSLRVKEAVE